MTGYQTGYLEFYQYKSGKIKQMKCKSHDGTGKNVNVSSNAAGWYSIYKDKKGYVHADWWGGIMGYDNITYKVKNGKVIEYIREKNDTLKEQHQFYINGKKTSQEKYGEISSKLEAPKNSSMIENNNKNRKKIIY